MDPNQTLLSAIALQIAARLNPRTDFRIHQEFLGGGTKLHLFFTVEGKSIFSFNIFAGRLDSVDDRRIEDRNLFGEIFTGRLDVKQAAQEIACLLDWEVRRPIANTYSLALLGLGLVLQRFAFEQADLDLENGYLHGSNSPAWFSTVCELEDWPGGPVSDESAAGYWRIEGKKGVSIFDLTEACVYLVGEERPILHFDNADRAEFYRAINKIEFHLRFGT